MSPSMMKNEKIFHDALPGILDTVLSGPKLSQIPDAVTWAKKVLDYNLKGGKYTRGVMTMLAYELLEKPENISHEYRHLSIVLGWALEILQGTFCVIDDIMDGSTTRRGLPCWYLTPNVGLSALNDGFLMLCCVKEIIEIYFLNTPHFTDIVQLFHKADLYTCMGQYIDYMLSHQDKTDYSLFTMERYAKEVVPYKNCFFTFKLPILLALTLVKDVDMNKHKGMDEVCDKLSILYQMQDDYIDCFGDETKSGKAGTDIQERKCTWLAVNALQHCNQEQRKLFEKHYGINNPEDVAIIKKLYEDLKIKELYKKKEVEIYNDVIRRVQGLPSKSLSKYFSTLIDRIYKRDR